jgi:hypothetical protein
MPFLVLSESKLSGRGVVTMEPISRGSVIMYDRPFINAIKEGFHKKICAYCNRVSEARLHLTCKKCEFPYYCSTLCQRRDEQLHILACPYLNKLKSKAFQRLGASLPPMLAVSI